MFGLVATLPYHQYTTPAVRGVLTAGVRSTPLFPCDPAPNLAYADLLELENLAEDVLLHRDTDTRREYSGFAQLSIFAQNGTSPFSQAFCD